jgi:hypothetical protein
LANDSKKEAYPKSMASNGRTSKALGLGLVSAASAVAGGLAVAWWYRKTLTKLQNPIVSDDIQKSESPEFEEESTSRAG